MKRVVEGELRCEELSNYLDNMNARKCVWISEDGTAITPRINYDSATDQIVGLVLPFDCKTGSPKILSYEATSAETIINYMKNNKQSQLIYVVMAQPIDENLPPFILQLFGLDSSSFSAQDVVNRWKYIKDELAKFGISVHGFSSDGDPRLLSAMCFQMLNNPNSQTYCVQDHIHIATKMRNRLLRNGPNMLLGKSEISVEHLKRLIRCCPKEVHGLTIYDICPKDRQNFSSFEKICLERVSNALAIHVPGSKGTIKYLKLAHDVTSSYMDYDLKPTERIFRIWRALYLIRIWREHILSHKTHTLGDRFITSNAFKCIEINARSLIAIIRKCRDDNTSHLFIPTLYQSQTCEKTFASFVVWAP